MTHQDLEGTVVSEGHVAESLGFADVSEMRRWETKQGQRVAELERKLSEKEQDADRFRWEGLRMLAVLERVKDHLTQGVHPREHVLLAIEVVAGRGVDWDGVLKDWLRGE